MMAMFLTRDDIPAWVSSLVAFFSVLLLAAALGLSYIVEDDKSRFLIIGAIITNATTVINFLFGSSKGSQKKDDTISAFGSALAASTPGSPGPPMQPVAPPEPVPSQAETATTEQRNGA